ncbi:MAG: endonuclease III [Clostridia bacterium]|nr:endonuclease III [Clostridia bacterium]
MKTKRERADFAVSELEKLYPDADCALEYAADPFRLLVMARLSAQCTDKRVNEVSKELFERFPDAAAFAEAPIEEIEELVRPCGVFRVKARNIKDMSAILVEKTGGKVPPDRDFLLTLPGVGRKIANLVMGDVFGEPGIVADTHCIRLSNRMGLCRTDSPLKVELGLDKLIDKKKQSAFCHRLVDFGRDCCRALKPDCENCPLKKALESEVKDEK